MTRAKLLAVLVVALALLFFVGIGAGAIRRDGEQSSSPPSDGAPLDWLKQKVAAEVLTAPCLDSARRELSLAPGQTCSVTVPGSWYPVRRLSLRLKTGTLASLTIKQKGTLTEKRSLTAGKALGVDVFGGEATLTLTCTGACAVAVE